MQGNRKGTGKSTQNFSKRGPCLTASFFAAVDNKNKARSSGSDLSQRQYLLQCGQRGQSGESLIPQLAEADLKIDDVKRSQRQLNLLQKDHSLFASKQDQVSQLNIQIKDALTEIQVDQEEISAAAQCMSKQATGAHKKSVQAGIDTLNCRMMGIAGDFKSFLEEHQKVVRKQEAKKERIIGASGSTRNKAVSQAANSITSKRNKMRILPQHASQQANRMAGARGISGADYAGLPGGEGGDGLAMEVEDQQDMRNQSIESIEKTLYDILNLFKRFGTIVQNHEALVQRIDHNAEEALYDVEAAKEQLSQVYEDTSNNRKLMLKIFFILICFCTFYILFVL